MHHYKTCGLDNVFLINGYDSLETSEGEAISIHNIDDLHRVIADSIIKSTRPFTGKEYRFLRIELDMSQKTIGQFMGKTDQSIAKWEKDELGVPKLADASIRQLYAESMGENSKLRSFFDILNELDRNHQELQMRFEECEDGGWTVAAA